MLWPRACVILANKQQRGQHGRRQREFVRHLRPGGLLLRDVARPRGREPARPPGARALRLGADRRAAGPRARRRDRAVQPGHHLHRLQRARRDRPHPAVRRHPAPRRGRGLGACSRPACASACRPSTCSSPTSTAPSARSKDGVIPARARARQRRLPAGDARPELPFGTYIHVAGTDLVRDGDGRFLVLEDNARTPSGVSYVVENRHLMQRSFSDLMRDLPVRPVSDYGRRLLEALREVAPRRRRRPAGRAALARRVQLRLLRARLPRPRDGRAAGRGPRPRGRGRPGLHADGRRACCGSTSSTAASTTTSSTPRSSAPTACWACRGLMRAYRKGTVALANAIGTGVADDKAVYAYVPRLIRYYLAEEPILDNVDTWICREPDALRLHARPLWPSWSSSRWASPAATASRSARARPRPSSRSPRARLAGRPGQLHQPAGGRALSVAPDAASTAGSSRATSTCGRSRSPAAAPGCCRAA